MTEHAYNVFKRRKKENKLDRKDLKIQALLEKVSSLTARYENEIADLRVELTVAQSESEQVIADLNRRLEEKAVESVPEEDSDSSD